MTAQAQTLTTTRPQWVRTAIYANVAVTDLTGLVLVLGSGTLATHLGLSSGVLVGLGIALFAYAIVMFMVASRWLTARNVFILGVLDVVWIVGTELLMISNAVPMTSEGQMLIMATNVVVGLFAVLEFVGARQMQRS